MYSNLIVVAAPKSAEHYQYFKFMGKKAIDLPYRGISVPLEPGQRFGVRKSRDGKKIRLVLDDEVNRVFTLSLDIAKKIAKTVKVSK
jgi:hypothetical protein